MHIMVYIDENWVQSKIKHRSADAHKKSFGHVLIVAGSHGKAGAGILCARAALRSGCGLVTVVMPEEAVRILLQEQPELMYCTHAQFMQKEISQYDAIAIGPGLGFDPIALATLQYIIQNYNGPLILDADVLTYLAQHKNLFKSNQIITPHPGEFERLMGLPYDASNRAGQATQFVDQYPITLVLKGAATIVASKAKDLFINTTGNDGMATAGSGDVLTGIITAIAAQGYNNLDAACLGVFIHGLAGDLAIKNQSKSSLVAGDLIEQLKHIKWLD